MAARTIVGIWEIQHWLKFSDGQWIRITEDKSAEVESESNTYEPSYLDRKEQPSYSMGKKTKLSFEVDALAPGGIQQELAKYEDAENVPVDYMRTLAYDLQKGTPCPPEALVAKTCTGQLNMNQFKGESGEAITLSGEISFTSPFKTGTYNPTNKEFKEGA